MPGLAGHFLRARSRKARVTTPGDCRAQLYRYAALTLSMNH